MILSNKEIKNILIFSKKTTTKLNRTLNDCMSINTKLPRKKYYKIYLNS